MKESALHSINILIPTKKIENLRKIYNYISKNYENKYPLRNNWEPHIDIYTIRVKEPLSNEYIKQFEMLYFSKFNIGIYCKELVLSGDNKYIFVEFDDKTKKQIYELRAFIKKQLDRYRDLEIPRYFKDNWQKYTEEQRRRIKREGGPYEYVPHISVIKVNKNESNEILKEAKVLFEPFTFRVGEIRLNKQTFDKSNAFITEGKKIL